MKDHVSVLHDINLLQLSLAVRKQAAELCAHTCCRRGGSRCFIGRHRHEDQWACRRGCHVRRRLLGGQHRRGARQVPSSRTMVTLVGEGNPSRDAFHSVLEA